MLLLQVLLASVITQRVFAAPFMFKSHYPLPVRSLESNKSLESTLLHRQPFQLVNRGSCFSRHAGEEEPEQENSEVAEQDGCYTLQDSSNNDIQFELAPGQSFQKDQSLGGGFYENVTRCILENGREIAVKRYEEDQDADLAKHGFDMLVELERNKHIIKGIAFGTIEDKAALAMELATNGSVESKIQQEKFKGKDNEKLMKDVGDQILDGLSFMHSKRIAHTNIMPGNVAFKGDTVRIIDFDLAKKDLDFVETVPRGKKGLGAPEAKKDGPEDDSVKHIDIYGNDVWGVARLLIWMTTGEEVPGLRDEDAPWFDEIWQQDDPDERVLQIKEHWPEFSDEFMELLADVFCKQEHRIKMAQLKEDFKDVRIYC